MKPNYFFAVAMVAAAFLGGAAMQWLTSLPDALAAEPSTQPVVRSLQVRELALVDETGRQRAILHGERWPAVLHARYRGNRRLTPATPWVSKTNPARPPGRHRSRREPSMWIGTAMRLAP